MRGPSAIGVAVAIACSIDPARAADRHRFDAPSGPLGVVVTTLALQAGATIAVPDPALASRHSKGVKGILDLNEALAEALRGTGAMAVFHGAHVVGIVALPRRERPPIAAAVAAPPSGSHAPDEIVVTAAKQSIAADRFPGSVAIVTVDRVLAARSAADGTAALVDLLPSTGATNLGPARNKLFIRGIADSSFNGPTQATVGQYLGDVRLNYAAPDPNLNLYDLERVEVLVGPQGALYGAGSLGGVIRLVPHVPDPGAFAASLSSGLSFVRNGRVGGDIAGMMNVPVVADRLAVRLVAFSARQPGYIDAPAQGRQGINTTGSIGQRFDARLTPGTGWSFDLGVVIQNSTNRDGQYTLRGTPPLTRDAPIPQPFDNTYYLGYVTAKGPVGTADLVTTTSLVRHRLQSVFDATGYDGSQIPQRYVEGNSIVLFAHETRLSGGGTRSPWVGGLTATFDSSALMRSLGPAGQVQPITGVVNDQLEAALFGQLSRPLLPRLTGTVGGRFTLATGTGRAFDGAGLMPGRETRKAQRFSGTLALDWRIGDRLSAFFHYQQGYRAGGLAVAPTGSTLSARRFAGDDLNMNELGLRLGRENRDPLVVRAAIFAADWRNIQADLVDANGLPYTANIGRGRIVGLDGRIVWRSTPSLSVTAAVFVNASDLYAPAAGLGRPGRNPLPNVPVNGQRLALDWHRQIGKDTTVSARASIRYVGRSLLGVAPTLDIPQGGYALAALGARLDRGRVGFGLDIENVTDTRGNSFSFGNPFGVAARNQITPVRPRTIRLSLDAAF